MKKVLLFLVILAALGGLVSAGGAAEDNSKPVVMVWLPNESGDDSKAAREAVGDIIAKALGRKVEHKLTTDYNIAIEAIANNQGHFAFFGAQQYVLASAKNKDIKPLVINAPNGNVAEAKYFSWLAVKLGNETPYKSGSGFTIDPIQGKKFSWVSTSSTSGFKVPSAGVVSHFKAKAAWANLKADDLLEGGAGKFFAEVLYGASHQGSAVNLLTGKVDVAAFCDTCVNNYVELISGKENTAGAVYQVRKDAADPFTALLGEKFVVVKATPVLNGPIVVNTKRFSTEQLLALRNALTSDATANNTNVFVPKGAKGMYKQGERFIAVDESFFDPIRALNK